MNAVEILLAVGVGAMILFGVFFRFPTRPEDPPTITGINSLKSFHDRD